MAATDIEMLEQLFRERKSLNEFSEYDNDEEYQQYNEYITNRVKPLLVDNLNDIAFVAKCISYFPHLYEGLTSELQSNFEVALLALRGDSKNLSLVPEQLKNDRKFREALFFINPGLSLNFDFVAEDENLVNQLLDKIAEDEYFFKDAPQSLRKNRNFCCQAAARNGMVLHFMPLEFYEDEELTRIAITQNGLALKYAHPKFQSSLALVSLAVRQDFFSIQYAHPLLFNEQELNFVWEKSEWADYKREELELLRQGYEKHRGLWHKY